jgi:hypothetical protein
MLGQPHPADHLGSPQHLRGRSPVQHPTKRIHGPAGRGVWLKLGEGNEFGEVRQLDGGHDGPRGTGHE